METGTGEIGNGGTSATQNASDRKRKGRRILFFGIVVVIGGLIIYYFVSGMTHNEGTQTGVLVSVNRKGYVFKTLEGVLDVRGIRGGADTVIGPGLFRFSVRDRVLYDSLEKLQGSPVTVRYEQVNKTFFWQGESEFFVTEASPAR